MFLRDLLIVFGVLIGVIVLLIMMAVGYERFVIPQYLYHKSKSFDAEREMIAMYGEDAAWMANPAKSFDAEAEGGFLGKTMKFY